MLGIPIGVFIGGGFVVVLALIVFLLVRSTDRTLDKKK